MHNLLIAGNTICWSVILHLNFHKLNHFYFCVQYEGSWGLHRQYANRADSVLQSQDGADPWGPIYLWFIAPWLIISPGLLYHPWPLSPTSRPISPIPTHWPGALGPATLAPAPMVGRGRPLRILWPLELCRLLKQSAAGVCLRRHATMDGVYSCWSTSPVFCGETNCFFFYYSYVRVVWIFFVYTHFLITLHLCVTLHYFPVVIVNLQGLQMYLWQKILLRSCTKQ